MRDEWTGPTAPQIVIITVVALASLACIIFGVRLALDLYRGRDKGETIPGFGIGLTLFGIMLAMLTYDLAIPTFTGDWSRGLFYRWWFVTGDVENGFESFLGNPTMAFFAAAVFIGWLGLPSLTQLRRFGLSLVTAGSRLSTVWAIFIVIAGLCGGVAAGLAAGIYIARFAVIPATFIGGFLAMGIVVAIGLGVRAIYLKLRA